MSSHAVGADAFVWRALAYSNGTQKNFFHNWRDRAVLEAESLTHFLGTNIIIFESFCADLAELALEINLLSC